MQEGTSDTFSVTYCGHHLAIAGIHPPTSKTHDPGTPMLTMNSSFGHWLKQQRRSLDLTLDQLAERIGCSSDLIRKIEAGITHCKGSRKVAWWQRERRKQKRRIVSLGRFRAFPWKLQKESYHELVCVEVFRQLREAGRIVAPQIIFLTDRRLWLRLGHKAKLFQEQHARRSSHRGNRFWKGKRQVHQAIFDQGTDQEALFRPFQDSGCWKRW